MTPDPDTGATTDAEPWTAATTRVRLCGELEVVIDGEDLTGRLPSRQGRALFAFLALRRDHGVTRDELQDALWPNDRPADPAAGLASILARVRRAVGDDRLVGRAQVVLRLEPDAVIDVEQARVDTARAQEALGAGDPLAAIGAATAALDTLASPLLPELDAPWVEAERIAIGELTDRLLETRTRAALTLGGDRLAAGEQDARALVTRNPYSETGHELLIDIQARRGNVAEALRTFDALRVRLREELGTQPSAGVSELHQRLLVHGAPDAEPSAAAAPRVPLPSIAGAARARPFVGREEALARLAAAWGDTAPGAPRLVLIVGEPGVGKTRLAGHFATRVHAEGATVLYGRCDEEAIVPFRPCVEALRYYLQHAPPATENGFGDELQALARLVPELREAVPGAPRAPGGDSQLERYYLFEGVARVFAQAARGRPLLLILDDLHWADKPTITLLGHVMRSAPAGRITVLAPLRGHDLTQAAALGDVVAELRREQRVDRIDLEGLDERETGELLAARVEAALPEGFVRALRAETAGNPLFMEEAIRSLRDSGALAGEGSLEDAVERMGLPEGVNEVVAQRLTRIPPAGVEGLEIASALGAEFPIDAVAAASSHPPPVVLDGMEEAARAGLVVEDPRIADRYAFCHALVRRAVYCGITKGRRAVLHQTLGEVLEGRPDVTAAELAHHFSLAASIDGPERALRHRMAAAREAAGALAYEDAEGHLRHALELTQRRGDHAGERCRILLLLGRVCWRLGDAARAEEALLEAVESARARGDAEDLARAAVGLSQRYWEAHTADRQYGALLREALAALDEGDSGLRTRVLARLAENLFFTGEQSRGAQLSLEAVAMARRLGQRPALVTALMARHAVLLDIEHLDERMAIIDEVLAVCGGHQELNAEAHLWRLYDFAERGELDAARHEYDRLTQLAGQLKQPMFRHVASAFHGVFAELDGDVPTVERLAQEMLELGRRAQAAEAESAHLGKLFMLRRWQGRAAELPCMIGALSEAVRHMTVWRAALPLALVEAGDAEAGRAHYEALAADDFGAVERGFFWLSSMALVAETCVALDDRARAARLHALLEPYAHRMVQVSLTACWGSVERYLARLAATAGDDDRAEAHFEAALARHEGIAAAPVSIATRCDHAALLARRDAPGDRARAAELAAGAEAAARALGLHPLAERAARLRG